MEKKTLKKLNAKYRKYIELSNDARNALIEYLNEAINACGGSVELTGFYTSYKEANAAGMVFAEQFPAAICLTDKHGFTHNIYITRLYKKSTTFYIDGYDCSDDEWITGWYVASLDSMYSDLAYFVECVINQESEEEKDEEEEPTTAPQTILVGYQLVDEDKSFPCEFGGWDVFRTREDAEAYRNESLDPEEYTVIEEWATPAQAKMYRYHAQVERSFEKNETVWIKGEFKSRFVQVTRKTENRTFFNLDRIQITEKDTGDEWITNFVEVGRIYQAVKGSVCPKCGNPLYRGHWREEDGQPVCIECENIR